MCDLEPPPISKEALSPVDRVTIICVCFESSSVVSQMLNSTPEGITTVLVDNASSDVGILSDIAVQYGVKFLKNVKNIGFGAACNRGAEAGETEFLFFVNPDAIIKPGCLEALVDAADRFPEASAFNPAIIDATGKPVFKRGSVLLSKKDFLPRGQPKQDCEVPILSGAALFVRRDAFLAVGGFDEEIFLYHEDDDLSLRLSRDQGLLRFVCGAKVVHAGGRSSPRSPEVAALKGWHMGRSRVYAALKHGRPHAFQRALLQATMQFCSPFLLLSRRKRAKQLGFLRGVWSMRGKDKRKT